MDTYPKREKYFANRFVRLLTKSAAAQELGPEVCWLLTVVAHQEDSKRYKRPVTYYNEQLMPLAGFGGRSRLVRARDKAVAAGWLHYEQGGKGAPGKYWVIVPNHCADLPDNPCDESDSVLNQDGNRTATAVLSRIGTLTGTATGRQPDSNQDDNPAPSVPTPTPIPKEEPPNGDSPAGRSSNLYRFPTATLAEEQEPIREQEPPNKKKGRRKSVDPKWSPETSELPQELGETFRPTWIEWCRWRREEKNKAVTPTGARLQLRELAGWGLVAAQASVAQSMKREWTGLFPADANGNSNGPPATPPDRSNETLEETRRRYGYE